VLSSSDVNRCPRERLVRAVKLPNRELMETVEATESAPEHIAAFATRTGGEGRAETAERQLLLSRDRGGSVLVINIVPSSRVLVHGIQIAPHGIVQAAT